MATISGAIIEITGGYRAVQGTITADLQGLYHSATWNNAGVTFTGFFMTITDTASNASSYLADFRVGGAQKFSVTKAGALTIAAGLVATTGVFSGLLTVQSRVVNTTGDLDLDSNGANAVRINRTSGTGGFQVFAGGTSTLNLGITDAGVATFRAAVGGITTLTADDVTTDGFKAHATLVAVVTGIHFKYGVTAATAVAVASTHKIEVRDTAGTTYYLLATT